MPRRSAPAGPPTMAELRETLWKAADKLRGSMDAAQYRDFVLGLVFLKYVSDAFAERRDAIGRELRAEGTPGARIQEILDDRARYLDEGQFWVPEHARWGFLTAHATSGDIGERIDAALDALMRENDALTGVIPKIFAGPGVDQRRLGELVRLLGDARFTGHLADAAQPPADGSAVESPAASGAAARGAAATRSARDVLGEVYEYFLDTFARAEGRRGGEFYTPRSVVRLMVEIMEPYQGRVYDPCCGSGGMFVQAEKFLDQHVGARQQGDIRVYGQELNERTWRLATMNLAIHGIAGNLGERWDDAFRADRHPDLRADFILANPPFNMSDWARTVDDPRWRYGVPPAGNANFAWIQHIVAKLAPDGAAGIVMANGSMSARQSGEGEIRAALVEDDLVACMVALPAQLFRSTQIPACLWFLARNKAPVGGRARADRRGETLFIDARAMGSMTDRTERVLTSADIAAIAGAYHAWRGTASARDQGRGYADIPGFCFSATTAQIRAHGHILTAARYVGACEPTPLDDEPITEKITRLSAELLAQFDESARVHENVRAQLARLEP